MQRAFIMLKNLTQNSLSCLSQVRGCRNICAETEQPECVCACVCVHGCMHRGIEGDSQEKGYLLRGPGDLSVLTSSPSRLRCSRWRLPELAEIDGEHGGHRGPAEFWTEPVGTNQPCCSQTAAPLSSSLLSPSFFSDFFFIALLLFLAFFSLCHSGAFCIPVFLSLCHSIAPLCPPTSLANPPSRRCLSSFSRFGCHETAGVSASCVCGEEYALNK